MNYLVLILSLMIFSSLIFLVHKFKPNKSFLIIERILPIAIAVVMLLREYTYDPYLLSEEVLARAPMTGFFNIFTIVLIWMNVVAVICLFLRPFFQFKLIKNFTKYISLPVLLLNAIFMFKMIALMQGSNSMTVFVEKNLLFTNKEVFSLLYFLLPFELGMEIPLAIYFFIKDYKMKTNRKDILNVFVAFFFMLIAAMPQYVPQLFFGRANPQILIVDITAAHRYFIYFFLLVVPFAIYFALKDRHPDEKRFALIFISLSAMVAYMAGYKYDTFLKPWEWPFHLCNTAMFIIPICFVFKSKPLFYFTYFINVAGAMLAILMPNYVKDGLPPNVLSPDMIEFWYNHALAVFMPLLGIALGVFEKAKLKQFYYSIAGFAGYFICALALNVIFTARGHEVDFFFINTNFVGDKLGPWAERLFDFSASFTINGYTYVFHPIYQVIFFIVYIGIGIGVWFVYELGYTIADSYTDLAIRLKKIRLEKLALQARLNGRSVLEPMRENTGIKYELRGFGKRYATSKNFAVRDANLVVYGGEIFGFLGPNGAGKSTIIKSTVGIQTITEGKIEICGYDCKTQPVQAKSLIGFVPDHYALYEKLTGREYLNYIADIYDVPLEERNMRMEKYVALFELSSSIDNPIKTYSHGMKQKIAIMAQLIHNPKVWILDEPLTGLDPQSIYQVKECMKQHAQEGNIVFFSSHIIDIVEKLCNRIAIIKKGKIRAVKTIEEIENEGWTLEEYYLNIINQEEE